MNKSQENTSGKSTISDAVFVDSDVEVFLKLSKAEFSKDSNWKGQYVESLLMSPKHVIWKHCQSPFGASTFVKLKSNNNVVGRVLMQPRQFQVFDRNYTAACDMDMLVVKTHRMPPSNFIRLIKCSHQVESFDLVYHTANEITHILYGKLLSLPNPFSLKAFGLPIGLAGIFFKLFGYRVKIIDIFSRPIWYAIVIISNILSIASSIAVRSGNLTDFELENLSNNCLAESGAMLARNNVFLDWRFGSQSDFPGKLLRVEREGILIGYIVVRKVTLAGMNHLVLMDFLIDSKLNMISKIALRFFLLKLGVNERVDTILAFLNPFNKMSKNFFGFPFMQVPEKLLPHETPIFIKTNHPDLKDYEFIKTTHMTLADLDYF